MFETLKIYLQEELDREKLSQTLVEYGYHFVKRVSEEGDFSVLGETATIYPVTFEYPLRIELSVNKVERIRSLDPITYDPVEDHNVAIILPIKGLLKKRIRRKELVVQGESPIDNFIDIDSGDYVVHLDHGIGKYLGMERVKVNGKYLEHLAIEYAAGDKLLVPFNDIEKVHKYLVFEKRLPIFALPWMPSLSFGKTAS